MKNINSLVFVLFLTFISSIVVASQAQAQQPPPDGARPQSSPWQNNQPSAKPANLLQLLNLTVDQLQQIRLINQETHENVRAANAKLRQARQTLDQAIYADVPNQAEVDQRARELGDAQSEAIRARAAVEFRIRQVLTPEQLIRFRDLRRQFEQKLKDQMILQKKNLRQSNNKPI